MTNPLSKKAVEEIEKIIIANDIYGFAHMGARIALTDPRFYSLAGLSKQEWVSVESENEPTAMEDVLMSNNKDGWVSQGYLHNTGEWYNVFDNECPCKPTHWMPLPKSPIH